MIDRAPPDSGATRSRSLLRVGALAVGVLVPAWLVLDVMDPPPTYSCSGPAPPGASEARADYLPGALAVALAAGCVLAFAAWRWWRDRERPSGARSPAWLIVPGLVVATWVAVVADAFIGDRAGGTVLYSFFLAGLALLAIGVLFCVLLFHLYLVKPSSLNWEARADMLTSSIAWLVVLGVYPLIVASASVVGKDTTLWC